MMEGEGSQTDTSARNYGSTKLDTLDDRENDDFNKRDKLAIIAVCFTYFADAVEIYLPAVLTQVISCELKINSMQEGLLAAVLYSFYAGGCFLSGISANHIGRRRTILCCLYSSFVVATVSAVSPNFVVLLISRGLTGILVGSNYGISNLYWVEIASSSSVKKKGLLFASLSFSAGAGYTSLLAYAILNMIGWRIFLVVCSLPLFLIPLYLMQFHLPESPVYLQVQSEESKSKYIDVEIPPNSNRQSERMPLEVKLLIAKLSFIYFVNIYQGWGHILFLPSLYRAQNQGHANNGEYCNAIYDDQFIKMTIISGLFPLIAKCIGFFTSNVVGLVKMMVFSSSITTASFGVLYFVYDGIAQDVTMAMIKAAFALLNITLWFYMTEAFDVELKATSTTIIDGSSKLGALIGSLTVAFFTNTAVVLVMFTLGMMQLLTTFSLLNWGKKMK